MGKFDLHNFRGISKLQNFRSIIFSKKLSNKYLVSKIERPKSLERWSEWTAIFDQVAPTALPKKWKQIVIVIPAQDIVTYQVFLHKDLDQLPICHPVKLAFGLKSYLFHHHQKSTNLVMEPIHFQHKNLLITNLKSRNLGTLICILFWMSHRTNLANHIWFFQLEHFLWFNDLFGPFNFTVINTKKRPPIRLGVSYNMGSCPLA